MHALFQNALTWTQEIAMIGQYRQDQDLTWVETPSYSVSLNRHGQLKCDFQVDIFGVDHRSPRQDKSNS
jgi:hypothetical protein